MDNRGKRFDTHHWPVVATANNITNGSNFSAESNCDDTENSQVKTAKKIQ